MSTEQARKEIIEETLSNRDELRRALIGELDKDVGDGFLDAVIEIIKEKGEWDRINDKPTSEFGIWGMNLALATEDIVTSYANSVNIKE